MSEQEIENRCTDAELAAVVTEALRREADIHGDRIAITVTDGWVTLSGTAEHVAQWSMIDCTTRYLPGVRGVTNLLRIAEPKLPSQGAARARMERLAPAPRQAMRCRSVRQYYGAQSRSASDDSDVDREGG